MIIQTNYLTNETYSDKLKIPRELEAYRRYINDYVCNYMITDRTYWKFPFKKCKEILYSIIFYKKSVDSSPNIPYVILTNSNVNKNVIVYVNYELENLTTKTYNLYHKNIIINDMNKFLEAIRKCIKSDEI